MKSLVTKRMLSVGPTGVSAPPAPTFAIESTTGTVPAQWNSTWIPEICGGGRAPRGCSAAPARPPPPPRHVAARRLEPVLQRGLELRAGERLDHRPVAER